MANSSSLSRCNHCREYSFWVEEKLIYPNISTAPFPSIDLPQEIKKDFEEARIILKLLPM